MTLAGRHVVLGVSGGVACYKACTVARRLTEMGADVDVVLTAAAQRFVGAVTFAALTHRPVQTSLWERDAALAHVRLAQDTDLIVVAPATANLLARAAQGIADDFLSALLLAATAKVLVAPAMNDQMFAHPATHQNLDQLRERGWQIVGPAVGPLAEGVTDRPGRMTEPEEIVSWVERALRSPESPLAGKRVLVTAGATREELDPVRVVTNRSSGRMGYALAAAAFARGGSVTLISGPTALIPPPGVATVWVETTADLCEAVGERIVDTDLLLMAAAPSDFRSDQPAEQKRPRANGPIDIRLSPTDDILMATRDRRKSESVAVGFALETGANGLERARAKLDRKGLDLIVLNLADEPGAGFEVETNKVTVVSSTDARDLPLLSKQEVAEEILNAAEPLL